MSPIIQDINNFLSKHGIEKQEFGCELISFLPDSKKYLQRTGEERRCTRSWKSAVWRYLSGTHKPSKEVLTAMQNWKIWKAEQIKPTRRA